MEKPGEKKVESFSAADMRALDDKIARLLPIAERAASLAKFEALSLAERERSIRVINASVLRETPYTLESYVAELRSGIKKSNLKRYQELLVRRDKLTASHGWASRREKPDKE